MRDAKKVLIVSVLERTDHNHAAAARLLSVHPSSLHRLVRNLKLRDA